MATIALGGTREPPEWAYSFARDLGYALAKEGHVLRIGNAKGIDKAFYEGAALVPNAQIELYLPFPTFNKEFIEDPMHIAMRYPTEEAKNIASMFHPNWKKCVGFCTLAMGRNMHVALGQGLDDPADFTYVYTVNGMESGGTGQLIRVSKGYEIPVSNFGDANVYGSIRANLKAKRYI